jgi:hypothetical protein
VKRPRNSRRPAKCPHCGRKKGLFKSYRRAVQKLGARQRRLGMPLRLYYSAECGGWHLTSQDAPDDDTERDANPLVAARSAA